MFRVWRDWMWGKCRWCYYDMCCMLRYVCHRTLHPMIDTIWKKRVKEGYTRNQVLVPFFFWRDKDKKRISTPPFQLLLFRLTTTFFFSNHNIHHPHMSAEPGLSVKDAHGRQISLLNDACPAVTPPQQQQQEEQPTQSNYGRRRYHCTEPGCKKSFTTRYVLKKKEKGAKRGEGRGWIKTNNSGTLH